MRSTEATLPHLKQPRARKTEQSVAALIAMQQHSVRLPVAVVGGRPHSAHLSLKVPLEPLHHQLMRPAY